jgi:hypothetical protein
MKQQIFGIEKIATWQTMIGEATDDSPALLYR